MSIEEIEKQQESKLKNPLSMTFDLKTIDHLGVKLYRSFPPVIAELVSNAYDAEAKKVDIFINYTEKKAMVIDDGHGMTLDEINNQFLVIGRNRRVESDTGWSKNKLRKVTGKKGLGKLAVFGITEEIIITSISEGLENSFSMNYSDIKSSEGTYKPKLLTHNESTEESNKTKIELNNIRQNSITSIKALVKGLASRFQIFDENFIVNIIDIETNDTKTVQNEDFFNDLEEEFEWSFPDDFRDEISKDADLKWLEDKGLIGSIITTTTPLQQKHQGVIIYARKKLAQKRGFFNERSNDLFNSYATGYFHADFIDESNDDDIVATDRQSILWDSNEDLLKLRQSLDKLIKISAKRWRKGRVEKRKIEVNDILPKDFYSDLVGPDKMVIKNIENQLIKNLPSESETAKTVELLQSIKQQFQFDTFKTYVSELNNQEITVETMERISDDWEKIEINEMAKLAVGRIETIQKFEEYIMSNALETSVIQPFLEKFPWILDPRMTTFDREVTFRSILKEAFPDEELEGKNKRIDFLCSNNNGDVVIVELKRPNIKISLKEIQQARSYERFILDKRRSSINSVKTYLISDRYDMNEEAEDMYSAYKDQGKLEIKSYTELIDQAKEYHKHFIELQEKIKASKDEVTETQKVDKKN